MECLGLESGAAGWKVQMKPQSYGGHPKFVIVELPFSEMRVMLMTMNKEVFFSNRRACPAHTDRREPDGKCLSRDQFFKHFAVTCGFVGKF